MPLKPQNCLCAHNWQNPKTESKEPPRPRELEEEEDGFAPARPDVPWEQRCVTQGHCHPQAVFGRDTLGSPLPSGSGSELCSGVRSISRCSVWAPFVTRKMAGVWGFFFLLLLFGFSFSFANLRTPPSRLPKPNAESAAQPALTGPFLLVNGKELASAGAGRPAAPPPAGTALPAACGDVPVAAALLQRAGPVSSLQIDPVPPALPNLSGITARSSPRAPVPAGGAERPGTASASRCASWSSEEAAARSSLPWPLLLLSQHVRMQSPVCLAGGTSPLLCHGRQGHFPLPVLGATRRPSPSPAAARRRGDRSHAALHKARAWATSRR